MNTKSYIALSGFTCIVLVIIAIVIGFNYLRNRFRDIFEINYLSNNNFCVVTDDNGNNVISEQEGSIFGRIFNPDGLYSVEYCAFHPLMLTDKEFRENTLTLYGGPGKMFSALKKFYDGDWKLPDKNMIENDPILSTMILNPWYVSDDVYFTPVIVEYTTDLSNFVVDGKKLIGLKKAGLELSWGTSVLNYNDSKMEKCRGADLIQCEMTPSDCSCKVQPVTEYYLYIDNNLVLELPMQLFLGRDGNKGKETVQIKVGGKIKNKTLDPIQIKTLTDLDNIIESRFYQFKNKIGKKCENLVEKQFNSSDQYCKFFKSNGLEGIIITLRRIIVIHLPSNVLDQYVDRVDKKVDNNKQLDYLEFFLWLACKSYRDKLSYKFIPRKKYNTGVTKW